MLIIPTRKAFYHGEDGRLIRIPLDTDTTTFADPKIADRIHFGLTSNKIIFGPKDERDHIVIRMGDEDVPQPWESIVTWTEADDSPFYCIEPWMGPPNSPSHGKGIRYVASGHEEVFRITIMVKR